VREAGVTDTSWATRTLWVVAVVLLSATFVIAGFEGLKWAFGVPSMIGSTRGDRLQCGQVAQANPDLVARRVSPFAAAALLRACSERQGRDSAP
jgi:hypothetical protein